MDLKHLIARLEHRQLVRQTATTTMAILGLIGFGIMMVPILLNHSAARLAVVAPSATSTPAMADAYTDVHLIGQAAIVYDLTTGRTLFERNADAQLPLASLTKLITMYAAVNTLSPNAPVTISDTAVAQDGDSGLATGETFAFKDIARFALVASSNDAAEAIAEAAAGKKEVSNQSLLASAVAAAGLTQTYANNGTGLDESTTEAGAYGTAADIARLAGALLVKAPAIMGATVDPSVKVTAYDGSVHALPNTNQDIVHIPNALMSKTGYTDLAGGNLAIIYDAGINHPVAIVVLGSTRDGRFTDVDTLVSRTMDYFANVAPK